MAHYDASQPYFDRTKDPRWGSKLQGRPGMDMWLPGGGGGPTVTLYFMNKVWDPYGSGQWVSWQTVDDPDPAGASYPDPYGSGFGACTFFRVQGMRYA